MEYRSKDRFWRSRINSKLPVSQEPGDLAAQYLALWKQKEIAIFKMRKKMMFYWKRGWKIVRPASITQTDYKISGRQQNIERVRFLDLLLLSLQNGADLLWIETAYANVKQIASQVNELRK